MFPCTKCGACCRLIGKLVTKAKEAPERQDQELLLTEVRAFPFEIVDNTCSMYKEGVGCTVYDKRPDICRIDVMFDKYYAKAGMTLQEYYLYNSIGCNIMIDQLGLPADKKVILK